MKAFRAFLNTYRVREKNKAFLKYLTNKMLFVLCI